MIRRHEKIPAREERGRRGAEEERVVTCIIGGSGATVYSCLVDGFRCAMKELRVDDSNHPSSYSHFPFSPFF